MIKHVFSPGDMRNGYPVLEQSARKKLLILSDDLRLPSGVGCVTKEFVLGICHQYNIVQIAGAIKHPDQGKVIDMAQSVADESGIQDSYLKLYPTHGYGNPSMLRAIINIEKPDIILHFTDPRFWIWLYQMEHEIRAIHKIPITYLNIWDSMPFPHYNKPYYNSCDLLMAISKQTFAINKYVLGDDVTGKIISYVPHGINESIFHPILEDSPEYVNLSLTKQRLFGTDTSKSFVLFYNSRNIRRKMLGDTILAYKTFCDKLTPEEASKCALVLHTQPIDEGGTDLPATIEAICPDYDVIFSSAHVSAAELNILYNIADVTILLSSNEGFGLGTAESLMAGTPIIVNVTGGLQDQCGFKNDNGELLTEHDLTSEWASNHDGKFKQHGKWVKPVFPVSRALLGSVPTPYIFDDRCDWNDAANKIYDWYMTSKEQRAECGMAGREYVCDPAVGMSASEMCRRIIFNLKKCSDTFTPAKRFHVYKISPKIKTKKPTGITQ